jgi:alpha-methylacyl-CoA racemase
MFPHNLISDFAGGTLLCAFGILSCLLERATSGRGQVVDASMVDGTMYFGHFLFNVRSISPAKVANSA